MRQVNTLGRRCVGGLAALMVLTHCGGMGPEASEEAESLVTVKQAVTELRLFSASADARVEAASPTSNFGTERKLVADLSPERVSYLRFDVQDVSRPVSRAVLRLYALDGTSDGPGLHNVNDVWTEGGLTWNNRPSVLTSAVADLGAISSDTWVEYDVTGEVLGNGPHSFALVSTSGNGADFASREYIWAERRPQLILTLEDDPIPSDCMPVTTTTSTSSVEPLSDWYASQSEPTGDFSFEPRLRVDGNPRLETFITASFDFIDELKIKEVKLRLYATEATSHGPRLYVASQGPSTGYGWDERPTLLGGPVGGLNVVPANTWVEYDVTHLVANQGWYLFALVPDSADGVAFVSMNSEQRHLHPRLVFTFERELYCTYQGTGGGFTGWTRRLGGLGSERLHALATDSTGGFVTAGQFGNAPFPTGTGFSLARYGADGMYLWDRQVTTEDVAVEKLTVTPEGNILVVGTYGGSPDLGGGPLPAAPTGTWARALFLAKFSPSGETVWTRGFVATYFRDGELEYLPVFPRDVATDAQGSLIVTGDFYGNVDFGGGVLFAGDASVLPKYDIYSGGFLAKFSWEGQHLWSRAFENWGLSRVPVTSNSVATDSAGNILVGGRLGWETDLGWGDEGTLAPFIARYDASGALLWKRLFLGINGEVTDVGPLGLDGVAFIGDFAGRFTFAGQTYTVGDLSAPGGPYPPQSFFGTLSSTEGDGWLRMLELGDVARELVTDGEDTVTVTGYGDSPELGGGPLGEESTAGPMPFVARYSRSGEHHWSRVFDRNFEGDTLWPRLFVGQQPGGSLVVGSDFTSPIQLDGTTYTSRGAADLFFFQLEP